jgi:hypothetical protein
MTKGTKRAAAFLVASLLVLSSLGTALGAHPCPHHDGAAAAGAAGDSRGPGDAGSLPGHGAGSSHEHDASGDSQAHGPCTCMGECQAGAAPSTPAPGVGADLPKPPATPHVFRPAPTVPRAAIVPFSLPWGNAPPTL